MKNIKNYNDFLNEETTNISGNVPSWNSTYSTGSQPIKPVQPVQVEQPVQSELTYYFSTPLVIKKEMSAQDIFDTMSQYTYNSLRSGIQEAERKHDVDLVWLEDAIYNFQPEESELTDFGYNMPEETDDDAEPIADLNFDDEPEEEPEEERSPKEFYDDLDDEKKFEIYFGNFDNWKQFESEYEKPIILEFSDLLPSHQRNIQENIVDSFNEEELEKYCDELKDVLIELKADEIKNDRFQIYAVTNRELTNEETMILKDYISGQCSDGWGESYEQHEVEGYYISTWGDDIDNGETAYEGGFQ